ncbi:alpha-tocopherol transfer protein isoform X6 [Panthera tigris]|uniref:alpha-tocopherol transfer protein isoform X6 n=1 Tax=Panthera tigris TaxID=9694 RepID=UPI001C6FB1D6|nr:alpha-tocopherol transfer protein isoform X6 [Panthera tigris]
MRRGGSAPVRPRAPPSRVASAASFGRARMLRGARRAAVAGSRPEWEASALWAGSAAARDCGAGPEAQGRRRPPYDGEDVGGLQRRSHRRTAPGARAAVAGPPPEPPEAIHGHVGGWVSQPPSGQSCWAFRKSSHVQRKWPVFSLMEVQTPEFLHALLPVSTATTAISPGHLGSVLVPFSPSLMATNPLVSILLHFSYKSLTDPEITGHQTHTWHTSKKEYHSCVHESH